MNDEFDALETSEPAPVTQKRKERDARKRPLRAERSHRQEAVRGSKDQRRKSAPYPGLRFLGVLHRSLAILYALGFLTAAGVYLSMALKDPSNATLWAFFAGSVLAIPASYLLALVGAEICHILARAGVWLDDELAED